MNIWMNIDSCVFLSAAPSLELSLCSSCVTLELPLPTGVGAHPALGAGLWSTCTQEPPLPALGRGSVWLTGLQPQSSRMTAEPGLRCELKAYVKLIVKINPSNYVIIV